MTKKTETGFVWGSLGISQDVFLGLERFPAVWGEEELGRCRRPPGERSEEDRRHGGEGENQ